MYAFACCLPLAQAWAAPTQPIPAKPPIEIKTPNKGTKPYKMLNELVHDWLDRGHIVGSAIVVVRSGKVTFAKAYGVTKHGEKNPVDLDTVFPIGSITKTFTATLFATTPLKTLLALDTQVQNNKIKVLQGTLIKNLLSHTSGFSKSDWNAKIESGWSRDQMLDTLAKSPQKTPGSYFSYNNLAFSLLENEIASTLKIPFNASIRKYIIEPLDIKRTSIGFEDFAKQNNRAYPHIWTDRKTIVPRSEYSQKYHDTVSSSAGVNSSANDLAKFLLLQMGAFPNIAAPADLRILHQSVVEAADAKVWFKDIVKAPFKSFYGYGWRVVEKGGKRIVFHGGFLGGFMNFIAFSPEDDVGIIVLNNSESPFAATTAMKFLTNI